MAVPGIDKNDIKINLEKNLLSIASDIEEKKDSEKTNLKRVGFFCFPEK